MSDFVKKEDAIRICKMCASPKYRVPYIEQAFENIPTIDAVIEWIPCSERLPKESEQDSELGVLVTLGNGYSGIQFDWVRDGEHWYDWDGYVIAWMSLPKPYREREGE